ncbi:MAG TPA: hypothetical protein VFR35_00375 [Actinoplanes sp.]|nr:hypothetical protein [Actinoplanes sp.]
MDRLDGVLTTAAPLLKRVDQVLSTTGAAADHEVWPSLRRVGLLPWDAVQAVATLRPAALTEAAPELRSDARSYAGIAESLIPPGTWSGDAAEAYDAIRRRTADHLSGGPDSLDERLEATADLADALTDWMRRTRTELAVTLAEVLTSAEALSLGAETPSDRLARLDAQAAADVAARVLEQVAESYDVAVELITGSADLASPLYS